MCAGSSKRVGDSKLMNSSVTIYNHLDFWEGPKMHCMLVDEKAHCPCFTE